MFHRSALKRRVPLSARLMIGPLTIRLTAHSPLQTSPLVGEPPAMYYGLLAGGHRPKIGWVSKELFA